VPRREPPAVPAGRTVAEDTPALDPAPAHAAAAATGDAAAAAGGGAADSASADALSAMLAAAVPGTNFVDPLGGIEPSAEAETVAIPQDGDPPSANGSEAG